MPYICLRRTDIPDGILQILDLVPNTSLRNSIYDPQGQTKYVDRAQNDTVATSGGATAVTSAEYKGVAAYLIDNVEDTPNGDALTAAQANTIALAIIAALDAGSAMTLVAVDALIAATVAGSGLATGNSTGSIADVLKILAGGEYVLPAGSTTQTGGVFNVTVSGAFTTGQYRATYDTGAFQISLGDGYLARLLESTFDYEGTAGAAVVVYSDTGALLG